MTTWTFDVKKFNELNGYVSPVAPIAKIAYELKVLRLRLMLEELGELACAMHEDRLIDVADGLVDLIYVTLGTAVEYGLANIMDELFAEVQRANMSKDFPKVADGRKGGIKGLLYSSPDLATIIIREQTRQK